MVYFMSCKWSLNRKTRLGRIIVREFRDIPAGTHNPCEVDTLPSLLDKESAVNRDAP